MIVNTVAPDATAIDETSQSDENAVAGRIGPDETKSPVCETTTPVSDTITPGSETDTSISATTPETTTAAEAIAQLDTAISKAEQERLFWEEVRLLGELRENESQRSKIGRGTGFSTRAPA